MLLGWTFHTTATELKRKKLLRACCSRRVFGALSFFSNFFIRHNFSFSFKNIQIFASIESFSSVLNFLHFYLHFTCQFYAILANLFFTFTCGAQTSHIFVTVTSLMVKIRLLWLNIFKIFSRKRRLHCPWRTRMIFRRWWHMLRLWWNFKSSCECRNNGGAHETSVFFANCSLSVLDAFATLNTGNNSLCDNFVLTFVHINSFDLIMIFACCVFSIAFDFYFVEMNSLFSRIKFDLMLYAAWPFWNWINSLRAASEWAAITVSTRTHTLARANRFTCNT